MFDSLLLKFLSNERTRSADWKSRLFATWIGRVRWFLLTRDRLKSTTRGMRQPEGREAFHFASGDRELAAVWVEGEPGAPVMLLCHGIGETVEHWGAVQAWLEDVGVGSLVFNYSGYGRSGGRVSAENFDEDLVSAYAEVRRRVGAEAQVFVAGFSLGTGIAAAGVSALEPRPAGLVLCEAYTSFRHAVRAVGFPFWVALGFPDIWDTVAMGPKQKVPVLVMHSDADQLFPLAMAEKIAAACGDRGELVVVSGMSHNEPYVRPTQEYWGRVLEWAYRVSPEAARESWAFGGVQRDLPQRDATDLWEPRPAMDGVAEFKLVSGHPGEGFGGEAIEGLDG
jgi:uncharacterized protein